MNDSQFAYSGLTLDELRSMAASPQVGTMQAMPHSFRALADRVGEVADLLTHVQADLPNWWKGPAAEQAAATLARAAAEAREFHGSALAAASAVSRCAQVVVEQQNQMMSIPDVAEPGVTAVVQQPTTPFEALEAARQDATYQAAHEQAVQVVNGIAAQYVETRGQLTSIDFFRGENFLAAATTGPAATIPAAALNDPSSSFIESTHGAAKRTPRRSAAPSFENSSYRRRPSASKKHAWDPVEQAPHPSVITEISAPPETHSRPGGRPVLASPIEKNSASLSDSLANPVEPWPAIPLTAPIGDDMTGYLKLADSSPYGAPRVTEQNRGMPTMHNSHTVGGLKETNYYGLTRDMSQQEGPYFEAAITPHGAPTDNQAFEDPSDNASPIIPPYCGIGSIHSERERRNPRPAYLKERKSAWLYETLAAPPDGVISPDWRGEP